jgi:hypothetical protein
MAGLLDFLSPVNADGSVDAHKLGLLNMMAAGAKYSEPTRTPTSSLGAVLGTLAAGGQGGLEAAHLGPQLGLLNQQARGAQIGNDLNQINLDYYQRRQAALKNPVSTVGGVPAQPGQQQYGVLNGGAAAPGAPGVLSGGATPTAAGGGANGFLYTPANALAMAQEASGVPALKDQAVQALKVYETMMQNPVGFRGDGTMAPFDGATGTKLQLSTADATGKAIGGNNEAKVVAPGASLTAAPKTIEDFQRGVGQGGTQIAYTNPNPAQNTTIHVQNDLGGGLAKHAADIATASLAKANGAVQTLASTNLIRSGLADANIGPGSTLKTAADRLAVNWGLKGQDTEQRLAATRNVVQGLAKLAVNARHQLQGQGQITEGEQALLSRAETDGVDNLSIPEINTIVDIADRAAKLDYADHQRILGVIRGNPDKAISGLADFYDARPMPEHVPARQAAPAAAAPPPAAAPAAPAVRWVVKNGELVRAE